jgi:hypothetical protein
VYATEDFVTGAPFYNTSAIREVWLPRGYDVTAVQEQISSYERLENAACIEAYAKDFITDRRTLVVIASNSSTEGGSHRVRIGLLIAGSLDSVSPILA